MPARCAPDLVIMGAHGHGGLKDLIFGTTIDPVRHDLDVPVLIVRPGETVGQSGTHCHRVVSQGTQRSSIA